MQLSKPEVNILPGSPGTSQPGHAHIAGFLAADSGLNTGGDMIATGTVQAGTGLFLGGMQVLNSGLWAARPGSPVDGLKYFATDKGGVGLEFIWKTGLALSGGGTGDRWLTTQNFQVTMSPRPDNTLVSNNLTASRASILQGTHPDGVADVYITNIVTDIFVSGINSNTNFWTMSYRLRDVTGSPTTYSGDSKLATTASRLFTISVAVNAVVTKANFFDVIADATMTGAPGGMFFLPAMMNCRLVG